MQKGGGKYFGAGSVWDARLLVLVPIDRGSASSRSSR
jgi:hypothetical protein